MLLDNFSPERKEIPIELKQKLKDIYDHRNENIPDLLTFLYDTYPPTTSSRRSTDVTQDTPIRKLKREVRLAILHYHPEHQEGKDDITLELFKEISKILTERLTEMN